MTDLDPEVFRSAALMVGTTFDVEDETLAKGMFPYCCDALADWHAEKQFFSAMFDPNPSYFYVEEWWNSGDFTKENQMSRSIALLLCAEMLEEEPKLKVEDIPW